MQICCTKKLFDQIGIPSQEGREENDLFCWSAHLIIVNRRKTIVVVNDSNRFGFVLYGLKAKDFKHIDELIRKGIRESLRDEKIKEEIIEHYLQTAGDLVFSKTRGPKYVSRINKACERTDLFGDLLNPTEIFQVESSRRLNCDLVKIDKSVGYMNPYELLILDFIKFAGEEIIRCESTDLMIKLNLGNYSAWRRIITPEDINFQQLHEIIQIAFNWNNYHIYEFNILDSSGKSKLNIICEHEEMYEFDHDGFVQIDSETKLKDHLMKGQKIAYCYDYGDNWEHEIVVQGTIAEYNKNYPICVLGEGNSPPEDVGGEFGYIEFLKIMADPENEEYESAKYWAQNQGYKDFDIDLVNRRLKRVLR